MTQFNAPTYEIDRPTGYCAVTGVELAPGDIYMALLIESDDPPPPAEKKQAARRTSAAAVLGLKRIDVCWEAWQKGPRPEGIFGYWKATVAQPNQKRRLFVDDHVLLNLFRRLADDDDPQRIAFRFVLGLILMRKKLLRYDGTNRRKFEGADDDQTLQDWWQVTPKLDPAKGPLGKWNEDDRMEMLDPHLDEQQTQQVTDQLGEILEAEL